MNDVYPYWLWRFDGCRSVLKTDMMPNLDSGAHVMNSTWKLLWWVFWRPDVARISLYSGNIRKSGNGNLDSTPDNMIALLNNYTDKIKIFYQNKYEVIIYLLRYWEFISLVLYLWTAMYYATVRTDICHRYYKLITCKYLDETNNSKLYTFPSKLS